MVITNEDDFRKLMNIVVNELRGVHEFGRKLTITTIVIVAMYESEIFANLLYGEKSLEYWIDNVEDFLNKKGGLDGEHFFERFVMDFNTNEMFKNMIHELRKVYDDGFYKALFQGDEYAIACDEIAKIFEKSKNEKSINFMYNELKKMEERARQ